MIGLSLSVERSKYILQLDDWILEVKTTWFKLKKLDLQMIWRFLIVAMVSLMKVEMPWIMKR